MITHDDHKSWLQSKYKKCAATSASADCCNLPQFVLFSVLKNQSFATNYHIKEGKLNFIAVFADKSIGNHYRETAGQITVSQQTTEAEEGHFS